MKTLNAKRITAVAAGAALLGIGLAFAGPITFQNVPIISNSGQPVVQIVVGSTAKPPDAVSAGNIAAAIGNLAYTSVPVTASINQTQALSVLKAQVSGASYTLSNTQVWLNATGSGTAAGTYGFQALIGSVLNRAIKLNAPQNTKSLQGTGQYSYPSGNSWSTTASPENSAYTFAGSVPLNSNPVSNSNGGGVSFSTFTSSSNDNILHIQNADFATLLNNWGGNGETTSLWVTGFPVYDQAQGKNSFTLMSAGGAWEAIFNKPIQNRTATNSININVPIQIMGQNWTIINATGAGTAKAVTQTTAIQGGKATLASSLAPLTTVYVGKNLSAGGFTVQLADLGQPNSNGVSTASINVYYGNTLTNVTQMSAGTTTQINVTGHKLFVNVNNTFAGLYAYQKWAKIRLYANVFNVTNGQVFNKTTNPGWNINLLWTNTTQSSGSSNYATALYGIIIYNTTPVQTLLPGQSFSFIENPAYYKVTFIGETLGAGSFDGVTLVSNQQSGQTYQNLATAPSVPGLSISNITEPGQYLTVTSQIPNAFSYAGQVGSSVNYLLTPYELVEVNNAVATNTAVSLGNIGGSNVVISYIGNAFWVNATNPLTVTIKGYTISSGKASTSATTQTVTFTSNAANSVTGTAFYNVSNIQLSRALPGGPGILSIAVKPLTSNTFDKATNDNTLALLVSNSPAVQYQTSGLSYLSLSQTAAIGNVLYNQQNGQTSTTFNLTQSAAPSATAKGAQQYFTYTMNEVAVSQATTVQDKIGVGIYNSSAGIQSSPLFYLNYSSSGSHNNVTYTSSGQTSGTNNFNVNQGFRTERGSKIASITPTSVTINFAKAVDTLSFAVGTTNQSVSTSFKLYGPFSVGQAVTGIPTVSNVSIGPVKANITVASGAQFTISGLGSVVATPSVSQASTPVWLQNLSSTAPLVVLDSGANPSSNLILIGSGFVNTLSQQLQNAYNISVTPTTQITQAYGTNRILVAGFYANQTQAAANNFINQLYAQASQ